MLSQINGSYEYHNLYKNTIIIGENIFKENQTTQNM